MREIKFRAWMPKEKKWYKGNAIQLTAMRNNTFGLSEANGKIIELQQWTVLTDRHGVEIYEGDIIKVGNKRQEVIFRQGQFITWDSHLSLASLLSIHTDLGVVGNIYENKDLLK